MAIEQKIGSAKGCWLAFEALQCKEKEIYRCSSMTKVTSNSSNFEDTFAGRKEKLKKADKEASDLIISFGFNSAVSVAVCLFAVLFYDQFYKQI